MRSLDGDDLTAMIVTAMRSDDWPEAERLGARLDRLPTRAPVPIVSAALYYAQQGLRVFPLQPRSKIPHKGTRGCLEASSDPQQIEAWWRRWPDSNVGIATGHLVDVIDIDGPVGVKSWAIMNGLPPILGTVSTPRHGGNHLYIAALGLSNKAGLAPGIDIRGAGGYVVAPPSVNADGVRYYWRRPLALAVA
jgi:hypothetical protein